MSEPTASPTVLAIHAHPDDIEFQCAGTLGRLQGKGCRIVLATMTPGDCGSAEHSPDEIAQIRRNEAQAAADLLEAEYICLEFRDLSVVFDNESRRRTIEVIRRVRPDIVITAPPVDYMCDHEVTSQLVRDACFSASVPNYSTRQWDSAPAAEKIPFLYYVDPIEGVDHFGQPVEPEFIVDISSTFELKQQMLACHASQRNWLLQQHGIDEYLESCRRWSAARGQQAGVEFGEAFRQHKGHPYPHENRLWELLKE